MTFIIENNREISFKPLRKYLDLQSQTISIVPTHWKLKF